MHNPAHPNSHSDKDWNTALYLRTDHQPRSSVLLRLLRTDFVSSSLLFVFVCPSHLGSASPGSHSANAEPMDDSKRIRYRNRMDIRKIFNSSSPSVPNVVLIFPFCLNRKKHVLTWTKEGPLFECSRLISAKTSGPHTACQSASTQHVIATFFLLYPVPTVPS